MNKSLYDEIGGHETLSLVHKIFYDKIYAHPWIGKFFEGFNQQVIEDRQSSFMSEKFGGPAYKGKPLKQVHENMYITQDLANLRHELLKNSLIEASVPNNLIDRWLKIDSAFMTHVIKASLETFYRDYQFTYKKRIIHPKPNSQ